jgi:hypothetical protein
MSTLRVWVPRMNAVVFRPLHRPSCVEVAG